MCAKVHPDRHMLTIRSYCLIIDKALFHSKNPYYYCYYSLFHKTFLSRGHRLFTMCYHFSPRTTIRTSLSPSFHFSSPFPVDSKVLCLLRSAYQPAKLNQLIFLANKHNERQKRLKNCLPLSLSHWYRINPFWISKVLSLSLWPMLTPLTFVRRVLMPLSRAKKKEP